LPFEVDESNFNKRNQYQMINYQSFLLFALTAALGLVDLGTGVFNPRIQPAPESDFCKRIGVQDQATGQQQMNGQICNSTPMGLIPIKANMVSTMISSPVNGASVSGAAGFTISFTTNNLMSGNSADLNTQFMISPQTLASNGKIEG
jgi:hypothetical protein